MRSESSRAWPHLPHITMPRAPYQAPARPNVRSARESSPRLVLPLLPNLAKPFIPSEALPLLRSPRETCRAVAQRATRVRAAPCLSVRSARCLTCHVMRCEASQLVDLAREREPCHTCHTSPRQSASNQPPRFGSASRLTRHSTPNHGKRRERRSAPGKPISCRYGHLSRFLVKLRNPQAVHEAE